MNREDIIRMAREAGGVFIDPPCGDCYTFDIDNGELECFFQAAYAAGAAAKEQEMLERIRHIIVQAEERGAAAAKAEEREACAKVCESEWSNVAERMYGEECAAAIRARGETK